MSDLVLEIRGVRRQFQQGTNVLQVLKDANLSVKAGELVALVAPSGAGKSTLLHIAGLLERPNTGSVRICGYDVSTASDATRTRFRRERLGFLYQFHHLLPEFTAIENVMLPMRIWGHRASTARKLAETQLATVGLADRLDHRPGMLSGGEQQRVALCRALANSPDLLLADEPTGNLDVDTTDSVFSMLLKLAREKGLGGVIATHNPTLAKRMDYIVTIHNGAIKSV